MDAMRLVTAFGLSLCLGAAQAAPLAVRAGHLLDPATEKVRDDAVLVIENGRVTAIGDQAPAGAEVLDLSGKWVLPGFIDAHTHVLLQGDATEADYNEQALGESLAYRALRATKAMRIALDHGFTSLRDLGTEGAGFADVDLRRAVDLGIVPGPRLFVATKALAPTGAYGPNLSWQIDVPKGVELCDGADGCRRAVRDHIAHGADWIKVYADRKYFKKPNGEIRALPNFTADELAAIVDQAHRTGLRVAAHSMTPTGHALALGAGVDTIEHGPVLDDASIAKMVEQGVYWCPTAITLEHVAPVRSKTNPIWNTLREEQAKSFERALKAGVKIALGTDAGGFPWDGPNQATELSYYVKHGMTTWQALRAAATVGADLLDKKGELGTLAVGARADLVALDADPIKDIAATERASVVMKDGVVVKH
jgi:imidazolonepropionase-like amidohydrolase